MTPLIPIVDLEVFVSTRDSLHQVAEHVLARARHVDDGKVELTAYPGGFATPLLAGDRRVRIDGVDVVVDNTAGTHRSALTTIAAAAAFVGVEPGFPTELYAAATPLQPRATLPVDHVSADSLAAWFGFTAEVLEQFAAEVVDGHPSPLVLWPEHFDQAVYTNDSNDLHRANYGASPGDAGHAEPYLYVGPWGEVTDDKFWNAPHFNGAVLSLSELVAAAQPADVALRFLRAGRALLTTRTDPR